MNKRPWTRLYTGFDSSYIQLFHPVGDGSHTQICRSDIFLVSVVCQEGPTLPTVDAVVYTQTAPVSQLRTNNHPLHADKLDPNLQVDT